MGLLALAVLVALAVELGRHLATRVLGEREPLAIGALAFVLGLAAAGLLGNFLLRTTMRIDVALGLLGPLLLLARLAAARWQPGAAAAPAPLDARSRALVAVLAVAVVTPMVLVLSASHFWDEWECHMPVAGSIARGVYPPVYPYLPDLPLNYHFGYDLLAAFARRLSGAPIDRVFDGLSALLFLAYFLSAGALLRRHAGGRLSPYLCAAALVWLGGLAWLRAPGADDLEPLIGRAALDGYPALPPAHNYFLQKPMALGLPLWVSVLALLTEADRRADWKVAALAGAGLGFLELSEFALFVATACGAAAWALVAPPPEGRTRGSRLLTMLVALGVALLVGAMNGGFMSNPRGHGLDVRVALRLPYFARTTADQPSPLSPYLWQLGLPVLVAPLSALWALRRRQPLALLVLAVAAGSFAIPHFLRYRHSSDVEKFFVIAAIAFALLLALAWLDLATRGRRGPAWLLSAVLGVGLTGAAPMWVRHFVRVMPEQDFGRYDPHSELDAEVARWLDQHSAPHERVLTSSIFPAAGGLLTPIPPWHGVARAQLEIHGYDPRWIAFVGDAVERALRTLDPEDLARLRIRWVVMGDEDAALVGPEARARLREPGQFRRVFQLRRGSWFRVIYEYAGAPAVAGAPAGR
ncbi:MAG TPA: hypothetical protein VKN99_02085 [Polyangia bacterium]|nr:hypothetical protein [Polyangia bacterium]